MQGALRRFAGGMLRSERNLLVGSSLDIWERALADAESRAGGHDAHGERLCRLPKRQRGVAAKGWPQFTVYNAQRVLLYDTRSYSRVGASYVRIYIKVGTSYFERCQSSKLVGTGYIRAPHWFLGTNLAMATACSCLECDVSF